MKVETKNGCVHTFLNEKASFTFNCGETGYGFGFGEKVWVKEGGWRIKYGESEIQRKDLAFLGSIVDSGSDRLGIYRSATFRWGGKIQVSLTFRIYENPYVVTYVKVDRLEPGKHIDLDFPMFVGPGTLDDELYLSAIASEEPPVFPMIGVFKTGKALEKFSKYYSDEHEFLPIWIHDDNHCMILLPMDRFVDYRAVNVRRGNQCGFSMRLSGTVRDGVIDGTAMLYYSEEGCSETLLAAGKIMQEVYGRVPPSKRLFPNRYLGYSTANGAYYFNRFDEKTVLDIIEYLRNAQVPVRWMQLDVMWYKSSVSTKAIRTLAQFSHDMFEVGTEDPKEILRFINAVWGAKVLAPDREVFPNEFKNIQMPIGVWIWTTWFDRETPYAQKYPWIEEDNIPRTKEFWLDLARSFKDGNIVWVETDNLCEVLNKKGLRGIGDKEKWLVTAIEAFGEYSIPVQMCMSPSVLYPVALRTEDACYIRTADDFRLGSDASLIYQNFYNATLAWAFGMYPCFDVFFSSEASYMKCGEVKPEEWGVPGMSYNKSQPNVVFQALAHALSCGVVYIGDGIGLVDTSMVARLALSSGELVRADRPAVPIRSCYRVDPLREPYPLVVYTTDRNFTLVGVFNLTKDVEVYSIPLNELGIHGKYCAFEYFDGQVKTVEKEISDEIEPGRCKLFILCPSFDGFAAVGDLDKFITTYVIESVSRFDSGAIVNVSAVDPLRLGVICMDRPKELLVDGKVRNQWKYEHNLLEISLVAGRHTLEVRT